MTAISTKTSLKTNSSRCLKLYRAYSISFNSSNVGNFFCSWILKNCIKSSGKEKDSCCLMFLPAIKRQIGYSHVVVVRRRLRNVQKSVMLVQSCCLANLDLLHFCRRFSLLSPSLLLKVPIDQFSSLSLVTDPQVFAKVFSSQFPTRF